MLTEPQRIALDQREYRQDIDRHVKQMQSEPVPFSVVRNGKLFAKINLASLRRQLELATAEERPHVEEEIAECLARLERCTAELAEWGDDVNEAQDLPRVDQPRLADEISETLVKPEVLPASKPVSKVLKSHRRRILKDYRGHLQPDTVDHLARRLAISKTQLYGMVRGDTSRYGADTLNLVLQKLECSRELWDNPTLNEST